jgi:uncharacterized protein YjiS (DUF1127 family)
MFADTHESTTHPHVSGLLSQIGATVALWRERWLYRRELARWTERDVHDVGLSTCDIAYEADKPFWKA